MVVARLRHVLLVSRPRSWIQTGLPFLVAAFEVTRELTPLVIVGTIYFLGPYSLLLHGANEAYGSPSGGDDPAADPAPGARDTWIAIALANLPFLAVLTLVAGPEAGLALLLAVAAAIAYSDPPARTRERPILDSATSALHLVLPAVCGLLVAGLSVYALPWTALIAFTAWAMATHALEACRRTGTDRATGVASVATELGTRVTAAGSLLGYGVTVALVATDGPGGVLAAAGLALYLLLPAMVVIDPVETAAERAWTALTGLTVLVGLWLAAILMWAWGIVRIDPWPTAIAVTTAAVVVVLVDVVATRFLTRRRRISGHGRAPRETDESPLTIVVACHDAAADLPACLAALRAQTHPDPSILVVDDGSTDGTLDLARDLLGDEGQVIAAPPRPADWGGSWARDVGARAAGGDLILFVDPDTILAPVAVRILVEQLGAAGHDLLSGLTRYAMPTRAERIGVPSFAMVLFGLVPIWLSRLTAGRPERLAFAQGPLLLVRREAYVATGGYAATPGSKRAEIDLARTFARGGRRVGSVYAADLGSTRRRRNVAGVVAAWRGLIVTYIGGSIAAPVTVVLGQLLAFGAPLALPIVALVTGAPTAVTAGTLVPLLGLAVARLALAITQRQPITTIVWHPLTVALMTAGQVAGIADFVVGPSAGRGEQPIPEPPPGTEAVEPPPVADTAVKRAPSRARKRRASQ